MNRLARLLVLTSIALAGRVAWAEPLPRARTPEPLRPWIDWVLYGHEESGCPFYLGDDSRRQCAWPSRLALDLGERTGRFSQGWLAYRDIWVDLPGDAKIWPQEVRIDGRPAAIAPRGDRPSVRLPAGRHTVTGLFEWNGLPPLLQIPTETGLLALTVRGQAVPFPGRDDQGRLWLQKRQGEEAGEDRLEVTVHRSVADEIPLVLTTHLDLQVSGKSREVLLGRALLDRFVPLSLSSPLPARVETDGRLRIQVRPGRFSLDLAARHEGPVESLMLPEAGGPWAAEEVWVFDARPDLRLVTIEGAPAIDPQQTTLPEAWKRLPAYLMKPGQTMTFVQKRRGDSEPPPDRLGLQRTLWLDFDGGGFTIRDRIAGTMERGWRLEMPGPALLGRVAVNGQDQFLTRLPGAAGSGVEVRSGRVDIEADSRLAAPVSSLSAVGWDQDFHQASALLNLAPGWRLFHASGVDDVSATWISSWTLLDLFLALVIAMSVARLWGRRWGAFALLTLGLSWIEPAAPHWIWVAVLAGEALTRGLPGGRLQRLVSVGHRLAMIGLVLIILPFMVRQVRAAIYPALGRPSGYVGEAFGPLAAARRATVGAELARNEERKDFAEEDEDAEARSKADQGMVDKTSALEYNGNAPAAAPEGVVSGVMGGALGGIAGGKVTAKMAFSTPSSLIPQAPPPKQALLTNLRVHDPTAVVQTGPGLPEWSWTTVSLRWHGPVERGQRLRLFLIPPALNFVLAFLRVALLALLSLCLLGVPRSFRPGSLLGRLGLARVVSSLALGLLLFGLAPAAAHAEVPPADMLEALRQRLTALPDCHPWCASSPRLALEAGASLLRARMEVSAAAEIAVPLPGGADQWIPERVLLDGAPASGLIRTGEGRLWIELTPGTHQILLEGRLPERETIQIPLPLRPHRVTASLQGWRIEGLRDDGLAEDSLQLMRVHAQGQASRNAFDPGVLPPFVRVERDLSLGLKWQAETRVVRLTPPGTAIVLEVPLLAGESVTSPEVRVLKGKALVSLGPQASEMTWESALTESPSIGLRAPESASWIEVWRLLSSGLWHIETQGIPLVHQPEPQWTRSREWRPWPGETVTIAVSRPQGLAGQTLTIDRSDLTLGPGLRSTDATLVLSIRSSRGGQHTLTLPDGADLQSVQINGAVQPIRQERRDVTLPIAPGAQEVRLAWRQSTGIRLVFRAPEVRTGIPSVNARVGIEMPADRWTLLARGPRLGPAVLFWSLLIVALLVSIGLGRLELTPLDFRHWFLLSLGLTQIPLWAAAIVALWLLALGWRKARGSSTGAAEFNLYQLLLVVLTIAALANLFWSIENGLLGLPEMQIAGNGSTASMLRWYLDRAGATLPRPWVLSVPLMVYRLAMLAWALWLAQALLRWLRWGWDCFSGGGLWRRSRAPAAGTGPPVAGTGPPPVI